MEFIFLDADGIGKFETKFRDDLLEKSELTFDELGVLSKREFNELVNTIFSDVVVTKDNIHLYYEFMSDEDLEDNAGYIAVTLGDRDREIFKELFDTSIAVYDDNFTTYCGYSLGKRSLDSTYKIKQTIFGIKDTLKPIDEYIAEIKGSSEYKLYLSNLDTFSNWIKKSLFGKVLGIELNQSLRVEEGFIFYTPTNKSQYGGTVKSVNVKLAIPIRFINSEEYKTYIV